MAVLLDRRDVSAARSAVFNGETVSEGSGKSQRIAATEWFREIATSFGKTIASRGWY
jgi:hypothetical protein